MKCDTCKGTGVVSEARRALDCATCSGGTGTVQPEPKVGMGVTIYIGSDVDNAYLAMDEVKASKRKYFGELE